MFIRNSNKKLFYNVIKGELLYFCRYSYRNSPKTLTLHLKELNFEHFPTLF